MKKLLILFAIAIAANSYSQNCSRFYPFTEGAKFEVTNYDKKDRPISVTRNMVQSIESSGSSKIATIAAQVLDEKGKEIVNTTYKLFCNDNQIEVDFHSLLSAANFEQLGDVDMDISGTNIVIPNDISVGQTLPDAQMDMKMSMSGINMKMSVSITDRKVIGKEDVTTPAGTYNCYAITYNITSSTMGMNIKGSGKQWLAEGVGMVKQVDYDNKGKITSSTKLTSFSK